MDKQSEFLSFPTINCGKTRVDSHLIILNNVPTSSLYELIVIVTFQHVNRTFNVIFWSHCLTNVSIKGMCRSITVF